MTRLYDRRWLPVLIYSAVSLIILWRLLAPGYVLTLDMVFTPNGSDVNVSSWFYGQQTWLFGGLPFLLLLKGLGHLFPMWVLQKVILFLTLFMAGFSAYRLCPAEHQVGKYFAGLLYMMNPFVYVRFMAGQWLLLLGYAVTPLAIKAMLGFIETPTVQGALILTLLITMVAVFSSHMLVLVLMVLALLLGMRLVQRRRDTVWVKKLGRGTALLGIGCMALNLYWVVPILTGNNVLDQISNADLYAFAARSWGTGPSILFSLASMHGFWRGGYHYITEILPCWYLLYLAILFLGVYGCITGLRLKRYRFSVIGMSLVAVVALVLAAGISVSFSSGIFKFLFDHISFFKGFRDSQKFVALLVLAYSYLGGIGVGELLRRFAPSKKAILVSLALLIMALPPVYSLNMFGGFNGNLQTTKYPSGWYQSNDYLDGQTGDFSVLFLPWHWYMKFSWSPDKIINPAESFFNKRIIQGKNIEVGNIGTEVPTMEQNYIRFLLDHRDDFNNFGEYVAPLNVKYILLSKDADFDQYDFLYQQRDLMVVLENRELVLFANLHSSEEFYQTSSICRVKDWEEMLSVFASDDNDVLNCAVFTGGDEEVGPKKVAAPQSVNYKRLSPVHYRVEVPGKGWIIWAHPYDKRWKLHGVKPIPEMGVANAFYVNEGGVYDLCYHRFNTLLICYITSGICLLTLLALLGFLMRKPKQGSYPRWHGQGLKDG